MTAVDTLYERIGEAIVTARQQRAMSQEMLAACLRLSRTSLTNIEAGRQRTPLHTVATMAVILDCALADLLGEALTEGLGDAAALEIRAYRDSVLHGTKRPLTQQVMHLEQRLAEAERALAHLAGKGDTP